MNLFNQLMNLFRKDPGSSGPIPGAMGRLLASMGIHELGPHQRRGIPQNVLEGCKPKTHVPATPGKPALRRRDGKPIIARQRASLGGKPYQVTEHRGIPMRVWSAMINDQKRKAAGRWYSGKKVDC